jgi:hypothetical protein
MLKQRFDAIDHMVELLEAEIAGAFSGLCPTLITRV